MGVINQLSYRTGAPPCRDVIPSLYRIPRFTAPPTAPAPARTPRAQLHRPAARKTNSCCMDLFLLRIGSVVGPWEIWWNFIWIWVLNPLYKAVWSLKWCSGFFRWLTDLMYVYQAGYVFVTHLGDGMNMDEHTPIFGMFVSQCKSPSDKNTNTLC